MTKSTGAWVIRRFDRKTGDELFFAGVFTLGGQPFGLFWDLELSEATRYATKRAAEYMASRLHPQDRAEVVKR